MVGSFLVRGNEVQDELKKQDAQAEARKASRQYTRYYLPIGKEGTITFLDGNLNSDGFIDAVGVWEHNAYLNGHWRNYFTCIAKREPCPACAAGNTKYFATMLTVIDHSKYTDRNGKDHQYERRLFVAKGDTMKRLQRFAAKRGGLRGWQVAVSRVGEKSANVGSDFDFLSRVESIEGWGASVGLKPADVQPFDYEKVVAPLSADKLREIFGGTVIGSHDSNKHQPAAEAPSDPSDDDYEQVL